MLPDGRRYKGDNVGKDKGQVRRRAKAKAEELRKTGGGEWKSTDLLTDYIDKVSRPAIDKADLSDLTRARYALALRWLIGDCDKHRHKHSLAGHTIGSGIQADPLEALLTEIAQDHGNETAKQCRTVLTKYIIGRLMRSKVIAGNPIGGIRLEELTGEKKADRTRGGRALSQSQLEAVRDYLLDLDPAEGVVKKQGRWPLESLIAKRRNAIDQTLLQMATGLRSTEANSITWANVRVDSSGTMLIHITENAAKAGRPRAVVVLEPLVAQRLLDRRDSAGGKGYVIGSPTDPEKIWEARNRNKAVDELYKELAEALKIEILEHERSHVWRTTLRTLYEGKASSAVLNAQFGHSQDIAEKHYADVSDLSGLVAAAGLGDRKSP